MPRSAVMLSKLSDHNGVEKIATQLLRAAGVYGRIPTPLDQIAAYANLGVDTNLESAKESFLSQVAESAKSMYSSTLQKVLGIADLRRRVIYVDATPGRPRQRFIQGHEIGHQVIPWQKLNPGYLDDKLSLNPDTKVRFEAEANFFSAEVLFQGPIFRKTSRDFRFEFGSIFHLAEEFQASRHATCRRVIEESDEAVALIPYWPSKYVLDSSGQPLLTRTNIYCSPSFQQQFSSISIPDSINSEHDWTTPRQSGQLESGAMKLNFGTGQTVFFWEAWWNRYSLLVLLRKRPLLQVIKRILPGY